MYFRKGKVEDIENILEIIAHAKEYMKENNLNQWSGEYPNREIILKDIEREVGYTLIENNLVMGYVVVDFIDDEIYRNIRGTWKSSGEYASIHRCAIHKNLRGKGYGSELFNFAENLAKEREIFSVRVDTAPDNLVMRHLFEKNGYEYCGLVFIEGDKVAYEKILK